MSQSSGPQLTLVVPVFNGSAFLRDSLDTARAWLLGRDHRSELLVVDDGSTDETPAILEDFARSCAADAERLTVTLVRNSRNRGKGFSVRRALVQAAGAHIVFTDADLTYPIENVAALDEALRDGADLAYGSRMHPDSRYVVAPSFFGKLFTRHFVGRTFNRIVRLLIVPDVLDTQAGLKGFRRDAARQLAPRVRMDRFSFDIELLFACRQLGMRMQSCPVRFVYRKEPSTVRLFRDSLAMLRDILRVRWRGFRGVYTREPDVALERELLAARDSDAVRRVTFVADDLGVSNGVNAGIARAARAGLVREASLCVTGAAVEEGAALARQLDLGVGLHLSCTLGTALSGPIRGLTDANGRFFGLRRVLWNCAWRRVDRAALGREVSAQIARLRELGVQPTHLNGHHHVHCFPVVRDVALELAAREGIRWTRLPAEHAVAGHRWHPSALLARWLARRCRPIAQRHGMRALPFLGLTMGTSSDFAASFVRVADRLPPGDYEWMVHPRVPDREFHRLDARGAERDLVGDVELATLLDPEVIARTHRRGVVPSSFTEMAG